MTAASNREYSATVQDNKLVAKHDKNGVQQTLCMIDLRGWPSFYLNEGKVICRDAQSNEFIVESGGGDSVALLGEMEAAMLPKRKSLQLIARLLAAALLMAFGFMAGIATAPKLLGANVSVSDMAQQSPALPPPIKSSSEPKALAATAASGQVWEAPKGMPENLRKAADRKLFTVDYSSGHPRTLYVFADPACPNCQRVEPLLQAASEKVNIVVFPVSVIGKQKSIASITPVLCLQPENRKAAWATLFDVGHDGLSLGQAGETGPRPTTAGADPGKCDIAKNALGINEIAYSKYGIPGTPWVIADDGRHVPQAVLGQADSLEAFLTTEGATDATK